MIPSSFLECCRRSERNPTLRVYLFTSELAAPASVKLDIRLAAGLESKKIAVEEAQKLDPRWIVLDGYFRKDKEYIQNHVDCHVALLKTKGVATLIPSKITGPECEEWRIVCRKIDDQAFSADDFVEKPHSPKQTTPSSSSYPLSWRTGFPRPFSLGEINEITNGFNNVTLKDHHSIIYGGVFGGFPVIVMCFPVDDQAVSLLKIVSRVRHRNILNLSGYSCVGDSVFFLCDCPKASLEACLLCKYVLSDLNKGGKVAGWVMGRNKVILYSIERSCLVDPKLFILWSKFFYKLLVCKILISNHYFAGDKAASDLSWDSRWGIALEIGAGIRYLHEEFVDGSIVNLSICSSNVALVGSSCAMLFIYERTTKQLKLDDAPMGELLSVKGENIDMNEQLRADVKDYGVLLLELITGQSRRFFEKDGQCLVDWGFTLLEKNLLNRLLDPRLTKPTDPQVANMARAALVCLKKDSSHNPTISEVPLFMVCVICRYCCTSCFYDILSYLHCKLVIVVTPLVTV